MGTVERRQRERLELRTLILDTAREIFAAEGYDGVTMRRIAERIEYSPTAIYFHFKDKDALIRELCDHDFLALTQQFATIARIADPIEKLRRAAYLYVQFGLQYSTQYRFLFMTPHSKMSGDAYAFIKSIVAEAIEHEQFRRELRDPDLLAQTVWAGIHGVAALEITMRNDQSIEWRPADQRATMMIDALIGGLTAQGK